MVNSSLVNVFTKAMRSVKISWMRLANILTDDAIEKYVVTVAGFVLTISGSM